MALVTDLYTFLKDPKKFKKEDRKFITVLGEFLIYDLIITFCWALLIGICTILFDEFASVFKSKKTIHNTTYYFFIVIAIIAPIIEELAFRFSLKITRITISISLAVQLIIYLHLLRFIHLSFNFRIVLMLLIAIVLYFSVAKELSVYLKQKVNFYIYCNIILFTLLHAFNFSYFEFHHYFFIPILISLQFFFALYISYVRLKHNFTYVVIFHITHNALISSLGLLIK